MTRDRLRQIFAVCYKDLYVYTSKAIWSLGVKLSVEECLSECYLHLDKSRLVLHSRENIEAVGKNWIKMNLTWKTSPIKRANVIRSQELLEEPSPACFTITDPSDIISQFFESLDREDKNIWELCYYKGYDKGKSISEYLSVSPTSGFIILRKYRDLEERLKIWIIKELN
jgi:hypothetical protein